MERRKLAALAFLPEAEIVRMFEESVDTFPEQRQPITDYVEDTLQ